MSTDRCVNKGFTSKMIRPTYLQAWNYRYLFTSLSGSVVIVNNNICNYVYLLKLGLGVPPFYKHLSRVLSNRCGTKSTPSKPTRGNSNVAIRRLGGDRN